MRHNSKLPKPWPKRWVNPSWNGKFHEFSITTWMWRNILLFSLSFFPLLIAMLKMYHSNLIFFFNLKILPSINLDNSNKWGNKKINNFTHWKLHVNIYINNCYLTIILFQFICFVCISNSKFWLRNKYLKYFLFNFENWIIKVIFLIKN